LLLLGARVGAEVEGGASKALGLQLKLRKSRTAKAAKRNYKIKVRR
jgi:hypothetical protein